MVVSGIHNRYIISHFLDGSDWYIQVDVYTIDISLVTFWDGSDWYIQVYIWSVETSDQSMQQI